MHRKTVKRWQVLPACEEQFQRELNMTAALKTQVDLLELVPWWRRIFHAPLLYRSQVALLKRTKGAKVARKIARQRTALVVAPEWLGVLLSECWASAIVSPAGDTRGV